MFVFQMDIYAGMQKIHTRTLSKASTKSKLGEEEQTDGLL